MKRSILAAAVAFGLAGCASIFNGQTQPVSIQSVPDGATISVSNRAGEKVHSGTTPLTVTLKRGAGYFKSEVYTIAYSKPGYATKEVVISGTMSGWYIGNLLLGGLVGMLAVDPVTGAMYNLPETVSGELTAETPRTLGAATTLQLVSTDSLTAEQKASARLLVALP